MLSQIITNFSCSIVEVTPHLHDTLSVIKSNEIEKNREKEISKRLSYVLRHKPDSIGIKLDEQGWTEIALLIEKLNISISELEYVVSNNAKQRFSIANNNIRANQGHSIKVNLGLISKRPPIELYHGTTGKNYERIKIDGLLKMNRNHVHLSEDFETAKQVGSRHGKPIILKIDCEQMANDQIQFFQSENKIWLTDYVNPKYISRYND